jgi:hypothetical protein
VNVLGCHERDGILNAGLDVWDGDIGIVVPNDLAKGKILIQQFQNALHGNARPRYTRLSKMYLAIDGNSVYHPITSQESDARI